MTRLRFAAVFGLVLLAAGCGASKLHTTTHSTSTATSPPTTSTATPPATTPTSQALAVPAGGPVPAGFTPSSFTAIGELTWWLLGNAPCTSPPCTSIVRTTDGGVRFVGIPAPRVAYDGPGSGRRTGVWQLRFGDAVDGFAYDTGLYVTHNGGSSWHPLSLGGSVTGLGIGGGEVYATVLSPSGLSARLMRSPVGRDDWVTLPAAGKVSEGLWVHGTDVFVDSSNHSRLLVSHDRGDSFAAYPAPVIALGCEYEEMQPPVVWAHCAAGTESDVWRSTDGGRSFRPAGGPRNEPLMVPNSAAFAAASSTVALVAGLRLYRTTNAGASYAPVGPAGFRWAYLGFTNATHGAALASPSSSNGRSEELFYTTNAGLSYHLVRIG
jgi:hypothetical protein